jgi:hypothetical protein
MFRILTSVALSKDFGLNQQGTDDHADAVVWYGHRVVIERRKCVVLMEQKTRYGLLFAGLTKPDFRRLGDDLRERLPLELGLMHGDADLAGHFQPAVHRLAEPTVIEPGRDRSVQAHINDFVHHARNWAARNGRLPRDAEESFRLGMTPNAMLKMGKAYQRGLRSLTAFRQFWLDAAGISADALPEPVDPFSMATSRYLPRKDAGTYRIRIELMHIQPAVWREVRVPANLSLGGLHQVIQAAMGWLDYHLHEFIAGEHRYGEPDAEWAEADLSDEKEYQISNLLRRSGDRIEYVYDFGDHWQHLVTLLAVDPPGAHDHRLLCLDGAGECPPEDVGGVSGYMEFLQAIRDPAHPQHAEFLNWAGGEFDPEHFDADEVNAELAREFQQPGTHSTPLA